MIDSTRFPYRHSLRLCNYDYTQAGAYFVTLCVHNRECLLGEIAGDVMQLSDLGLIVAQTWDALPSRFPAVELDASVIMPNHVHGIIVLNNPQSCPTSSDSVGAELALPAAKSTPETQKKPGDASIAPTLGRVIQAFKSLSAIACNRAAGRTGVPFWQRNYYEHIIRNDAQLARIRDYTINNPARWAEDHENPEYPGPL